ncbi:MAG: hypothetical protein HOI66_13865 [Verrucomicrobia bacterium]|nr:hypothetical protein [Verrucomicrobiota bacterium]
MTILEQLFTWTLRASWHASILVVVVLLIQQLFRKQLTATWRHALWFAILIRLAIPTMPSSPLSALNLGPKTPPLELPRSYRPPSIEPTFAQNLTTSTFVKSRQGPSPILESSPPAPLKPIPNKASEHSDLSSFEILSITWISIAMLLLVRVAVRNQRFAKSLNCDCADQLPHLGVPFRKAKKTLGIDHFQLRLSTSHQVKSPCIFGLLHPTLLIPVGLDKGLSATELECVFLHELAHLKRKDIAFSWIMCLLQCLHWFNPFVWFAMNRIRIDRELATDETVLKHASENQRHCYGELIIKLLDQWRRPTTRPAGVVGMVESKRDLSNRIRAIAKYSRSHRTPVLGLAIAACTILIFMLEADAPSSLQIEEVSNITVTVLADRSDKFISNSRVEVRNFSWNAKTKKWDKENKAVQNGATDTQGQALIEGILSHAC